MGAGVGVDIDIGVDRVELGLCGGGYLLMCGLGYIWVWCGWLKNSYIGRDLVFFSGLRSASAPELLPRQTS